MISNLVVASRGLRRSPLFTVAAVFTLALGIGANTTMFSVVNAVLLRPLPGFETDRLVLIIENGRPGHTYLDPELYLRLRSRARSFVTIAANQHCRLNFTGQGEPEQLMGPCATANWFEVQRAQAMLGRTFLPGDDQHGRNHVVVLDHAFWQRRFGGDPHVIGKTMVLDNEPWVVIGVMPPTFKAMSMEPGLIYTPYVVEDNPHGLNVAARLKPGVTLDQAESELKVIASQLARENADWKDLRLAARPLLEQVTGPQRPLLLLLMGAVSFVLLIACVNVANLLLARSAARRHEIEIRLALGASPSHIIRFVLAEAVLISAMASIGAVVLAYGGLRIFRPFAGGLPRAEELSVDVRVLVWTMLLGIGAALVFGFLPAMRQARPLRAAGMYLRSSSRASTVLVAGEVGLTFVLLVGAGLLIRTFVAIRSADLGYDARNVLTNFVALPPSPDGSRTAGTALFARIRERIAALPGVQLVATASAIPMFGVQISMPVHAEGTPERPGQQVASLTVISDDYFQLMRIPLLAGRGLTATDRDGSTPVVIVSESIARRYFAGKPLGKRIILPEFKFNIDGGADVAAEIAGVVGNVCVNSPGDCQAEHVYLPEAQNALRMENLLVRTAADPHAMVAALRHAMYLEAPTIPLDDPLTLEERTTYLVRGPRSAMWLLGVFAGLAMLLSAAGIYAVSAYQTTRRSREIGIRMALGAGVPDIAGLVYRGVLLPSAVGLGVGLAAAAGLTRLLKSLLFGVTPTDPVTLVACGAVLVAVSILAATGPALTAAWSDPARVLHRE